MSTGVLPSPECRAFVVHQFARQMSSLASSIIAQAVLVALLAHGPFALLVALVVLCFVVSCPRRTRQDIPREVIRNAFGSPDVQSAIALRWEPQAAAPAAVQAVANLRYFHYYYKWYHDYC